MTGTDDARRAARDEAGYAPYENADTGRIPPTHGTRSRYRKGCRCDACRTQELAHSRAYRALKRKEQTQ